MHLCRDAIRVLGLCTDHARCATGSCLVQQMGSVLVLADGTCIAEGHTTRTFANGHGYCLVAKRTAYPTSTSPPIEAHFPRAHPAHPAVPVAAAWEHAGQCLSVLSLCPLRLRCGEWPQRLFHWVADPCRDTAVRTQFVVFLGSETGHTAAALAPSRILGSAI